MKSNGILLKDQLDSEGKCLYCKVLTYYERDAWGMIYYALGGRDGYVLNELLKIMTNADGDPSMSYRKRIVVND